MAWKSLFPLHREKFVIEVHYYDADLNVCYHSDSILDVSRGKLLITEFRPERTRTPRVFLTNEHEVHKEKNRMIFIEGKGQSKRPDEVHFLFRTAESDLPTLYEYLKYAWNGLNVPWQSLRTISRVEELRKQKVEASFLANPAAVSLPCKCCDCAASGDATALAAVSAAAALAATPPKRRPNLTLEMVDVEWFSVDDASFVDSAVVELRSRKKRLEIDAYHSTDLFSLDMKGYTVHLEKDGIVFLEKTRFNYDGDEYHFRLRTSFDRIHIIHRIMDSLVGWLEDTMKDKRVMAGIIDQLRERRRERSGYSSSMSSPGSASGASTPTRAAVSIAAAAALAARPIPTLQSAETQTDDSAAAVESSNENPTTPAASRTMDYVKVSEYCSVTGQLYYTGIVSINARREELRYIIQPVGEEYSLMGMDQVNIQWLSNGVKFTPKEINDERRSISFQVEDSERLKELFEVVEFCTGENLVLRFSEVDRLFAVDAFVAILDEEMNVVKRIDCDIVGMKGEVQLQDHANVMQIIDPADFEIIPQSNRNRVYLKAIDSQRHSYLLESEFEMKKIEEMLEDVWEKPGLFSSLPKSAAISTAEQQTEEEPEAKRARIEEEKEKESGSEIEKYRVTMNDLVGIGASMMRLGDNRRKEMLEYWKWMVEDEIRKN